MGQACINSEKQIKQDYPVIYKIMKICPHRQPPLEKPTQHRTLINEAFEINYLELVLNAKDYSLVGTTNQNNFQDQQNKSQDSSQQKSLDIINSATKNLNKKKESFQQFFNRSVSETCFQNEIKQRKIINQGDDQSIIQNNIQQISETQTIKTYKSILKSNRSKSQKTATGTGKKVQFQSYASRNRNFFM